MRIQTVWGICTSSAVSGSSSAALVTASVPYAESTSTVQTSIWKRDRLIMFRSSMNAPRQTPVIPSPAITTKAIRTTTTTSHEA
ncbi:MAG: hypothetical protein OXG04_05520 [Acidobacteria bacterium]|nr:hypothetical protein [Acidobacteriota bacterium]